MTTTGLNKIHEATVSPAGQPDTNKKTPRTHQREAIQRTLAILQTHDRTQIIQACGTGKTLTALWLIEAMVPGVFLVQVPSLALMQQMLAEFKKQSRLTKVRYVCVCSDQNIQDVSNDQIDLQHSGLNNDEAVVSTNKKELAPHLYVNSDEYLIIFSTYQSVSVVGESVSQEMRINLAIFDEAHKTAGDCDKAFGYALHDNNIKIAKRVFMTATPRKVTGSAENCHQQPGNVHCMFDESIYGPVAYELPYHKAVGLGLVAPLKVIIAIQSDSKNDGSSQLSPAVSGNNNLRMRLLIKQIMESRTIRRLVTFHKDIGSAKSLARAEIADGITYQHINGYHSAGERQRIFSQFANGQGHKVMTNAKCLSEGVDIPSIDGVVFTNPKRSTVDIVQAIGRAVRLAIGKTEGYIILPLFVETDDPMEIIERCNQSEYSGIVDVLQQLTDMDETLVDQMAITLNGEAAYEDPGAKGCISLELDMSGVSDALNPEQLSSLQASIAHRCFGRVVPRFDVMFRKWQSLYHQTGNVTPSTERKYDSVRNWVYQQRYLYRYGKLPSIRVARLKNAGFTFNKPPGFFENCTRYEEYMEASRTNKDFTLDAVLQRWVKRQREFYRTGKLSQQKRSALLGIGFEFEPAKTTNKLTTIEANQLEMMIWSRPMSDVASQYGVSQRYVAKLAKKHSLVVPPRGFWSKVRSGKIDHPRGKPIILP